MLLIRVALGFLVLVRRKTLQILQIYIRVNISLKIIIYKNKTVLNNMNWKNKWKKYGRQGEVGELHISRWVNVRMISKERKQHTKAMVLFFSVLVSFYCCNFL